MLLSALDEQHYFCKNHSVLTGIFILPFLFKFDLREIYFFREPQNLLLKKMHKFLGTKIDKIFLTSS